MVGVQQRVRNDQALLCMLGSKRMEPEVLICLLYTCPFCKVWNKKGTQSFLTSVLGPEAVTEQAPVSGLFGRFRTAFTERVPLHMKDLSQVMELIMSLLTSEGFGAVS